MSDVSSSAAGMPVGSSDVLFVAVCPAIGCMERVSARRPLCQRHWDRVPRFLRRKMRRGHLKDLREVVTWVSGAAPAEALS